jgi:hypothetical protein
MSEKKETMELFSKTSPELRKARIDYINRRWGQLYALEKDTGEDALKMLFLTNAGGAVANLSFIGAIGKEKIHSFAKISLICFVVGLIFVGISKAKRFHYMSGLFKEWREDAGKYLKDELSWEELDQRDTTRTKDDLLAYVFPYTSFACFLIGCAYGLSALL